MPQPDSPLAIRPPTGWPSLPFEWPHDEPREATGARACVINTVDGRSVQGFALDVDPALGRWQLSATLGGPVAVLALARVARIELTAPLRAAVLGEQGGLARIPRSGYQCDYSVRTPDGRVVLSGQTVGHVEAPSGWFLFHARSSDTEMRRVFVPRASQLVCQLGTTSAQSWSADWLCDPAALRAALTGLRGKSIPRMGEALVALKLASAQSIERVLAHPDPKRRLGERLVHDGVIKPEELQMAIAFKLGYPLVDLTKFPIDAASARLLRSDLAMHHCAIPIMTEGRQIVVAVDGPARAVELEDLKLWPGMTITPVLARRGDILMAVSARRGGDVWEQEVPWR